MECAYLSLLEVWGILCAVKQRVCSGCGSLDSFRPGLWLLRMLQEAFSHIPALGGKNLTREGLEAPALALGQSEIHQPLL